MSLATSDPAVVEKPEVAAEPAEAAPPTPAPVEDTPPTTEGDAPPAAEGDEYEPSADELEVYKRVLKSKHAESILGEIVDERIKEREPDLEAQAQAKVATRNGEMDAGEKQRQQFWAQVDLDARAAARELKETFDNGYTLTTEEFLQKLGPVEAAFGAEAAKANEAFVLGLGKNVLPDQTETEQKALDDAYYDFRRNGRFEGYVEELIKLRTGRDQATIKDLEKQLRDRKGLTTAAEKLRAAAEAAGPGVGAETPQGRAGDTRSDEDILADPNTPVSKLKEIRDRQRAGG